jgi:predicted MFS family arabinose efflux permease
MTTLPQRIKKNIFQRFSSGVWLMMVLDIFVTIGFSIALPFLALYLHDERGISMSLVGTIFLVGGLCTAVSNIIGGMLSDRFGRRRLLLMVSCIGIFTYATLALLIGISAPIWSIALVYIVSRGTTGTMQPTISAIVADLSPKVRLTESYALVRVGGNVGFAIGPAIGGYLMTSISYGWLLSISAITSILITAFIYFFFRESSTRHNEQVDFRSTLAVAKDRAFLVFIICGILLVLSMAHMGSTLSVFTVDRLGFSTSQYGLLLTTNGIMVVVSQYPVAYGVNKLSKANGLILGSLFYVIGYLTLGWITSFNLAILTIIIITTGEVTFSPISSAVVAESAPPDKRGRYMGFYALSNTLGFSISPLFGGVLLDLFPSEPRLLWGIIAAVGVVAAIGFYSWGKMTGKKSLLTEDTIPISKS